MYYLFETSDERRINKIVHPITLILFAWDMNTEIHMLVKL